MELHRPSLYAVYNLTVLEEKPGCRDRSAADSTSTNKYNFICKVKFSNLCLFITVCLSLTCESTYKQYMHAQMYTHTHTCTLMSHFQVLSVLNDVAAACSLRGVKGCSAAP